MSEAAPVRKLGFWMAVALVMGNMIASGIFLLPASLAPYGLNGVVAWIPTAIGGIALALVFARLSRAIPGGGGAYSYTYEAFGPLPAFLIAWSYWVSVWVGNAAIASGAVSYLVPFIPSIASQPHVSAGIVLAFLWLLTAVNCAGVRSAGWVQGVTTLLKLTPLLAIAGLGLYALRPGSFSGHGGVPLSFGGVTASATLTLWPLLGLESATIPAGKVENPERTIPRATMVGTVVTTLVYMVACTAALILIPAGQLASSNAPFADVARLFWGGTGAALVAVGAAIAGFGALNGWILLQGEVPRAMAQDGLFVRSFGTTARGTPIVALIATSGLVTGLVLLNLHRTLVGVFTFFILLSTTAALVAYLACSLALLRLGGSARTKGMVVLGIVGAVYSLAALAGAGKEPVFWGAMLLLAGLPVYAIVTRVTRL